MLHSKHVLLLLFLKVSPVPRYRVKPGSPYHLTLEPDVTVKSGFAVPKQVWILLIIGLAAGVIS